MNNIEDDTDDSKEISLEIAMEVKNFIKNISGKYRKKMDPMSFFISCFGGAFISCLDNIENMNKKRLKEYINITLNSIIKKQSKTIN